MAQAVVLLVSAALCALGSALALQKPSSVPGSKSVKGKQRTISDIILSANTGDIAQNLGRSALRCGSCRWQKVDGVVNVPFVIDTKYTNYEKRLIKTALEEFSTVSCVRFIGRTSETSYISIENTPGCWSYIGRNGFAQPVSLQSTKCLGYGVIQHEVMHALSFNHEHTRPDRDKYVDIMWQYISQVNQGDFRKDNGDTLNTAYNYNSIMHYSSTTFTNTSGKTTIVPKPNPKVFIGQRYGLSGLDVVMINRLYACNLCRTKILGTSGTFSSSDASPSLANDNCLWLLHVPSNKLFLQFDLFSASSTNCNAEIIVYDGVTKSSPALATISPNQPHHALISSGLFLLVEYITDQNCSSSFRASYNAVTSGGTFTSNNSFVASPKYPSTYPNSVLDTSIILAPVGFMVSLNFMFFDLESSPSCSNDFLVIRDGGDTNSSIIGTYCGKIMGLVLSSTGNMMLLQFSSNVQTNGKGFRAEYSFVPPNTDSQRLQKTNSSRAPWSYEENVNI
ncbi:astacin-like metalloendopeptidase isoform X2 [Dendrobates tinctorius]|uniref:astacin-like metalloendopeptidase isoform X2 n=1 Tax=Dendrobates tinctorius TaxID=92724 RepID=UPI003CC92350